MALYILVRGTIHLYALYPDGKLKWKHETRAGIISSPAIGDDGSLYFGGWDNRIHSVDSEGKHRWEFETADHIWSSPAIGARRHGLLRV